MSDTVEIDLETEKALVEGVWQSRDELWTKMNDSVEAKDYKSIARFASLLEQVDQAISGARAVTFKLSAAQFAKLEAAGQKMDLSPDAFARQMVAQVLGAGAPAEAPAAEAPAGAAPVTVEAAAEAPPIMTLKPKAKSSSKSRDSEGAPPPVMTPVSGSADAAAGDEKKDDKSAEDDRRWFNRT